MHVINELQTCIYNACQRKKLWTAVEIYNSNDAQLLQVSYKDSAPCLFFSRDVCCLGQKKKVRMKESGLHQTSVLKVICWICLRYGYVSAHVGSESRVLVLGPAWVHKILRLQPKQPEQAHLSEALWNCHEEACNVNLKPNCWLVMEELFTVVHWLDNVDFILWQ